MSEGFWVELVVNFAEVRGTPESLTDKALVERRLRHLKELYRLYKVRLDRDNRKNAVNS